MRVIAVPVKSLAGAKRRVAPELTPLERGALTLAMLEDVLDAAQPVTGWQPWVVSPDEAVLETVGRREPSRLGSAPSHSAGTSTRPRRAAFRPPWWSAGSYRSTSTCRRISSRCSRRGGVAVLARSAWRWIFASD